MEIRKVKVYKTSNGILEETPLRAYAREFINEFDKIKEFNSSVNPLSFSAALTILENCDVFLQLLLDYKQELER